MEYRRLGRSGLQVSALSLGSWVTFGRQVGTGEAKELLTFAYESGVNFFDNAEVYEHGESEKIMGQVLQDLKWGRDTYCISSKVFWGGERPTQLGLHRKHIRDACDAALRRLQVDYIDLYFCHRPDRDTPIEETVWAMHQLVQQGKILYWGTSEWSAQEITEAFGVARAHHLSEPSMEQPQYNLFHRSRFESEYLPVFERFGIGTTIWSPLASGILSGKYNGGIPSDSRLRLSGYEWLHAKLNSPEGQDMLVKTRKLAELATKLEITTAQLAIAWCLKNPRVSTVILGASKVSQLKDNLAALNCVKNLTPQVLEEIETVVNNRPAPIEDYK